VIKRAYVRVGERQVHLCHAGQGPAVILIHQSPTSARPLDLQSAAFARAGFTARTSDEFFKNDSFPELPEPSCSESGIFSRRRATSADC
jgi:hypothetical protein